MAQAASPALTGLVIAKDEEARIDACLRSLSFCDELLVIDSGSTDGTVAIAERAGARVIERAFVGQNDQKEFGRTRATGAWVLNLDADEVASPELAEEARAIAEGSGPSDVDAYAVPFRNYFRQSWVRRCGYYPDPHVRLVRRERVRWDLRAPVHDRVLVEGKTGRVHGHVDHYSFRSLDHFLAKSARYADGFARAAYAEGRRAGASTILLHTVARFFKAYVLKRGCLEGALGLTISGLQAYETFQKYARLWELERYEAGRRRSSDEP